MSVVLTGGGLPRFLAVNQRNMTNKNLIVKQRNSETAKLRNSETEELDKEALLVKAQNSTYTEALHCTAV